MLADGSHQVLGLGGEYLGEIFGEGVFQIIDVDLRPPGWQTHIQFLNQVEGHGQLSAAGDDDEGVAARISDDPEHLFRPGHRRSGDPWPGRASWGTRTSRCGRGRLPQPGFHSCRHLRGKIDCRRELQGDHDDLLVGHFDVYLLNDLDEAVHVGG